MSISKFFVSVLLAAAAITANAQVYKCQQAGKTVFSDIPCEAGARPESVAPARGEYNRADDLRRRAETQRAQSLVDQADRERELNRRLAASDHDRKKQAEIDRCNRMKREREDAEKWSKEFRHPDNIRREQAKAKDLTSREFFECR